MFNKFSTEEKTYVCTLELINWLLVGSTDHKMYTHVYACRKKGVCR